MPETAKPIELTRRQRDILRKLRDGATLCRAGKEGLAGVIEFGCSSEAVSISTMNYLFENCLIETAWNDVTDWKITKAGLEAVN